VKDGPCRLGKQHCTWFNDSWETANSPIEATNISTRVGRIIISYSYKHITFKIKSNILQKYTTELPGY